MMVLKVNSAKFLNVRTIVATKGSVTGVNVNVSMVFMEKIVQKY